MLENIAIENIAIVCAAVVFLLTLILSYNINTVMLFAGILGIFILEGMPLLRGFLINEPYNVAANYTFTTVPLYLLMAQFIMKAGIVQDFYAIAYKLSRGRASVLGILTVLMGGVLGAISGSALAASAAVGQVSVPELRKRGFSPSLAATTAAASGSLSGIIPPAIILIIYGIVAEVSIAKMFMAAFLPGVLTMLVFAVLLLIMFQYEKKGEVSDSTSVEKEEDLPISRLITVAVAGLLIIASIFGGIYSGIFTPTEAGAVGAFIAFVVALVLGRVNKEFLRSSMMDTVKVMNMALIIIIGAMIFSRFITLSLLPKKLIVLLAPLVAHPHIFLLLLLVMYFCLFMFLDGSATILMTVPILLPILLKANIDPILFGVLIGFLSVIGAMSPPVGLCVYAVSGVTEIPIEEIFKTAAIWAIVASAVVGGALIVFPELALWLPSTM